MPNRRGQALMELAIFGMVALTALGFLIRIGMEMNYQQEIRMAVFRQALAEAAKDNGTGQEAMAVAYHYIRDRQMPNPSDGFMNLPRRRTEASAYVEWGDHLTFAYETDDPALKALELGRDTWPSVIVQQNEEVRRFRQNDFQDTSSRGVVKESFTTNQITGTITQDETGSVVSSSTKTCTETTLNLRSSDGNLIETCIDGGAAVVNWQ